MQERSADDRGNLLKGALFKVGIPAAAVVFLISLYGLYRFFNPKQPTQDAAISASTPSPSSPAPVPLGQPPKPQVVDSWRVVGYWPKGDSGITFAVQDAAGNLRVLIDPPAYKLTSLGVEVKLPEGGFATSWTSFSKQRGVLP